jgi:protein involved in polysaccharide export with SLBB domain
MPNVIVCLSAFILVGVLGCTRDLTTKLPTSAVVDDTTLGPGDLFEIRVYEEKELSGEYQVSPEGTIAFPFLGVLTVAGKDTQTISRDIAGALRSGGYLRSPYVSVLLKESNSKRVSVLGAVAKPGTLSLIPGMTVVQAISQAGGFTPLASKDETVVSRRVGGKLERYRIPLSDIARGSSDDFALRSGDIVFIPERVF